MALCDACGMDVSILPAGSRVAQRPGPPGRCAARRAAAAHGGAGSTAVPLRARGPVDRGAEDLGSHARWGWWGTKRPAVEGFQGREIG